MCTQDYFIYHCGCKTKGEFRQCDEKYDTALNVRCAKTATNDVPSRSYCGNHLVKEDTATVFYSIRGPQRTVESKAKRGAAS